jgi:hypothetical protein
MGDPSDGDQKKAVALLLRRVDVHRDSARSLIPSFLSATLSPSDDDDSNLCSCSEIHRVWAWLSGVGRGELLKARRRETVLNVLVQIFKSSVPMATTFSLEAPALDHAKILNQAVCPEPQDFIVDLADPCTNFLVLTSTGLRKELSSLGHRENVRLDLLVASATSVTVRCTANKQQRSGQLKSLSSTR